MNNKNPLFVVKENTVEQADNLADFFVKKMKLDPLVNLFTQIFNFLVEQVNNYSSFEVLKNWLDNVVRMLEKIMKRLDQNLVFFIKHNFLNKA